MDGKIKLFCDRVEEGIAVLLGENDTVYECPAMLLPDSDKAEGKHYLCTAANGRIVSAENVESDTAGENKKRLSALFGKSKKNK